MPVSFRARYEIRFVTARCESESGEVSGCILPSINRTTATPRSEHKASLRSESRRLYIAPTALGRLDVSMITRYDVEDWISELERSGVAPPTIDKAYRTLRACLETAVEEGKAGSNPARRVHTPELQPRGAVLLDRGSGGCHRQPGGCARSGTRGLPRLHGCASRRGVGAQGKEP